MKRFDEMTTLESSIIPIYEKNCIDGRDVYKRQVCMWCPFCLRDARNPSRKVCIITDEPIVYEEYGRGGKCPLKFESEE